MRGPAFRQDLLDLEEVAPYMAEFIGTFVLVMTVGFCSLAGSAGWGPVAIGFVLMALVLALGGVSGAHFNPAVSFMAGLVGVLKWPKVLGYITTQIVAGLLAGICFAYLLSNRDLQMPFQAPQTAFPGLYVNLAEVIYTAMLCFVVSSVAMSRRNNPPDDSNQFYGLAIGFVIIAGGYAVGGISGAIFNPAVAFGLNTCQLDDLWSLPIVASEFGGAAIAAVLYFLLHPEEASQDEVIEEPRQPVKCLSEFVGTFFLVTTVGLNIVTGSTAVALSAAAALLCMVFSLACISGAQFNPAVTLALLCRGACKVEDAFVYVQAQLLAALCAGVLYATFHAASPNTAVTIGLGPKGDFTLQTAGVCEFFFTFFLAFVVLSVATTQRPISWKTSQNFYYGLAIAACVVAGGFAIGGVSGGSLNPAVSVGVATATWVHTGLTPPPPSLNLLIYVLWELLGGALAAAIYRLTHAIEFAQTESKLWHQP